MVVSSDYWNIDVLGNLTCESIKGNSLSINDTRKESYIFSGSVVIRAANSILLISAGNTYTFPNRSGRVVLADELDAFPTTTDLNNAKEELNNSISELSSSSPFSKIAKVDSSTSITLGIGESCVLYPLGTTTASIGFKLSRGGSYTYVVAGTVIQNTSYATSIKTGTGLMRGYDVGSYYRCYYGTSTYTYSVTSYQNGVGINTWSTPADLYTSVSCLACVLKKSV